MKKQLFYVLISFISLTSFAQTLSGDWKIYPQYAAISQMEQTPDKVYLVSGNSLYSYDKNNLDTYIYTSRNKLNDNKVSKIYYNKDGNYFVITYDTGNIDILYDNGKIVNVPYIKDAVLNYSSKINDVTFDSDFIYIATKFGIVVYDEKNHKVKSSNIYGKEISLITCVGENIVVDCNQALYYIHKNDRFETFDNFTKISSGYGIEDMEGINNNMLLFRTIGNSIYIFNINFEKNNCSRIDIDVEKNNSKLIYGKEAYYYVNNNVIYSVSLDGEKSTCSTLPSEIASQTISIWDNPDEVWAGNVKGLGKYNITGGTLTTIIENFKPESLSIDFPFFFTTDSKGKLYISNHGNSKYFDFTGTWWDSYINTIDIDGKIEDITPIGLEVTHYANPASIYNRNDGRLYDTYQLVIDPEDDETYYIGTYWEGIYKVKNGKMLSHYYPATSSLLESYGCRVIAMCFDKENNLWCVNEVIASDNNKPLHFLPAEARKKETTTAEDWIPINLGDFVGGRDVRILMCEKSNMIFICDGCWSGPMVAYDTKGTYSNTSDDEFYLWDSFIDQDGNIFDPNYVTALSEDKNGRVWIGTSNGVIEITDPSKAIDPAMTVSRLKLKNENGVGYSGYLLDALHVSSIAVDEYNRKWMSTISAGVYYVSEDGDKIYEHYTTDNSFLPGGEIYNVYIHPVTKSLFIGTQKGLVEYYSNSSAASEDYSNVYAYPNPVKPNYTGWITIKGLMNNSEVKITDNNGNVLFTTTSIGGVITWDGCDVNGNRVKAGVYNVYASQTSNQQLIKPVTKIVVID